MGKQLTVTGPLRAQVVAINVKETVCDGDHLVHSPTTRTQLKEDPRKLKEVKEVALLCKKVVNLPCEFTPSSSTSHPIFVTLLDKNVIGQTSDGLYINLT